MPKIKSDKAEEAYVALAAFFLKDKNVSQSQKFGKGLRLNDKVFAMLVKGELVVKLPEAEVAKLIHSNAGWPFAHGKKVMKEWVILIGNDLSDWKKIATQAKNAVL